MMLRKVNFYPMEYQYRCLVLCFRARRCHCPRMKRSNHRQLQMWFDRPRPASTCTMHTPLPPSSRHPQSTTKSWERSAKLVKNSDVTNPYLERIRSETVDPALQLKTIEDELCGAIGKALGRQGEKIGFALSEMEKEFQRYEEFLRFRAWEEALMCAHRHNEARKRAIKARWELLVHRQAVGFTVNNHSVVHKTFPIREALPETIAALEESLRERFSVASLDGESKAWRNLLRRKSSVISWIGGSVLVDGNELYLNCSLNLLI